LSICNKYFSPLYSSGLNFEVVKREHIEQQSHLQIIATQLFRDEQRNPEFFSALDRRLVKSRYSLHLRGYCTIYFCT